MDIFYKVLSEKIVIQQKAYEYAALLSEYQHQLLIIKLKPAIISQLSHNNYSQFSLQKSKGCYR